MRAPDVLTANGTSTGSVEDVAASNSAMPCPTVSGADPDRLIRRMSASLSVPVIPPSCAHAPQASDNAGEPDLSRCRASASSAALAAA